MVNVVNSSFIITLFSHLSFSSVQIHNFILKSLDVIKLKVALISKSSAYLHFSLPLMHETSLC